MKNLKDIITEKLTINSKTRISNSINVDELNSDDILIYDSEDYEDESDQEIFWEDFKSWVSEIEKKYEYFITLQFNSLSKSRNIGKDLWECTENLGTHIYSDIINGKSLGYEVHLIGGHIEVHCINSGSRGKYYIYAVPEEIYNIINNWISGEENIKNFNFLFKKGNIIEIEDV